MKNDRARVLVITGPGKGKTTAALGMILRSLSYGRRVLLTRFAKARPSGELAVLADMPGMEILSGHFGMTPPPEHPDYPSHVQAARELFDAARRGASEFDLIVLDEICGMVSRDIVAEEEVATLAKSLRPEQSLVLTGRGAGVGLLAVADTVSEIGCVKHGYARGIAAQEGIEY